jgi:hypothetical protein
VRQCSLPLHRKPILNSNRRCIPWLTTASRSHPIERLLTTGTIAGIAAGIGGITVLRVSISQ